MQTAVRLLGIGWYVAISILGMSFGGYWLDRWLGLSPVLTLLGVMVGVLVAVVGMYRMLMAVLAEGPDSTDRRKQ